MTKTNVARAISVGLLGVTMTAASGLANAHTLAIDLSHPIPTYHPMEGDPTKPDMSKPWLDSRPHPTFDHQMVLSFSEWPTNTGYFDSGKFIVDEHHGTHLDSLNHFLNNEATTEPGMIKSADRVAMHQLTPDDLIGPIVLIDISGRVQRELDKNGGKPSPDTSVTDFGESSGNVVTAADVEAVADQLVDGAWLVMNLGWARFYFDAAPGWEEPGWEQSTYINGWNQPGMNREAVDKLSEIIDRRGIKLGGVAADNIGIDTGEGSLGDGGTMDTNVWYSHTKLFQRGVLILENVANLDQLSMVPDPHSCKLVVGAPKHVRGTGGPSRVFALCD